ncbi:aldehyde oxidase GLOX1-like [Argentina anserina]|uniref:aldehyde oxidase GLOX1-like n=1 Tax=Argentina anserina TaxID=57926 RepID=UPI0021767476|nr:aldehyde oxidase GLOX1-like [Potentilla anserina]
MFVPASKTCGRLVITAENPKWEVEEMPINRVMGDMIMLPTGDVLIINGAAKGTAGWGVAREPVLSPVLYKPWHATPSRFEVLTPTTIPRLYHSLAHLLSDGRILVGGSNPNANYNFTALYPTELSLEAFSPPYSSKSRPVISSVRPGWELGYVQKFYVGFRLSYEAEKIYVTMVAPSFTTHSFAMNQRLLVLDMGHVSKGKTNKPANSKNNHYYSVESYAPARPELAPPGYYLLFVVCDGVPSKGMWVRIKK